jgi:hypothetical protein
MAIPNVNEITSQLRMMSDQQLQQYAAMHKADPYILPMAVSESNARKQMRSEQQALSMGQQQPKVADADIAAMAPQPQMPQQMPAQQQLPEHQGIGALPAQNMQHMADGGIAGYAGGGMDEQLAYSNEPVMRMAGGGVAHFADTGMVQDPIAQKYQKEMQELTMGTRVQFSPDVETYAHQVSAQESAENQKAQKAYLERERAQMLRSPYAQTPAATTAVMPTLNKATMPAAGYTRTDPRAAASVPSVAEQMADTTGAAPTSDTGKKPPAPPTTRQPGAAPTAPAASSYAAQAEDMYEKNRPAKAQGIPALLAEQNAAREAAGVTGEAGEAQKQAYEKEASKAADDKKEMLYMAMIKGGLAAAGGTSQYAIKNIADGFGIGLDDAAKGMKELKLAEKERSRGLAAIEEARRAEKRGDVDKAVAARDKADERMANYNLHVMQSKTTLLGDTMKSNTSLQVAAMQERGANARAALPPKEMQMAMMLGTGKTDAERLESGMKRMQEVQAGKFNPMTSYADYLKAFAGKETLTPPLSFANYAAQFGAVLPR